MASHDGAPHTHRRTLGVTEPELQPPLQPGPPSPQPSMIAQ
jgi:hypothetical protein